MSVLKFTYLLVPLLCLSSCLMPIPQRSFLHQESRAGFKKYYNLKYLKTPHSREDILMAFGYPHYIDHEHREFIYLSSYYFCSQAVFIIIIPFVSADAHPITGTPNGHSLDVWYRLRFNQEWELIGARWYQVPHEQFNLEMELKDNKTPNRSTKRARALFNVAEDYYSNYSQHFTKENLYWDRKAPWWHGPVW